MKIKKSLLALAVGVCALSMNAQTEATESTVYDFQPHWFGQAQIGVQETLGESSFGKLLTFPNGQIAGGYQATPIWGFRAAFDIGMSRGSIKVDDLARQKWQYDYASLGIDALFDVTNVVWGFNPERLVSWNLIAGVGMNVAWHNNGANQVSQRLVANDYPALAHVWSGSLWRPYGRLGTSVDFRWTDNLKVGLELQANFITDQYNSKHAPNCDWYFNAFVGVKYAFGTTYTKRTVSNAPAVVEKIVEVPVEVIKEVYVQAPVEEVEEEGPMQRDVFFAINSSVITVEEMQKVRDIAEYLRANPESKCSVTGYADKNTGTLAINLRLAKQRSQAVAKALTQNYGISADRLIVSSMKNQDYQPFPNDTPDYVLNRVAICICD